VSNRATKVASALLSSALIGNQTVTSLRRTPFMHRWSNGQYVLFLQFFVSCNIALFCVSYESVKATPSLGDVISITATCD
jgi:hypothetical protein